MKYRIVFSNPLLLALFLALAPTALASSTWYVDGVNGSDSNDCKSHQAACKTIGHAISLASSADSITVAAATYTENLTIGFSLKILGSGASTTIIDGGGVNTVVEVASGINVTLSKLTIQNGFAGVGAGIRNFGKLTINNSTISANKALERGCLIFCLDDGGGIYSVFGTVTINDSTISGNSAGSYGGGIYSRGGPLTISNSTISGNSGISSIYNGSAGRLTISNSTISGNSGGVANQNFGGGTATLQNTIVANNLGGNCSGSMISNGYNLSSDTTCNFSNTGDLNNTDPMLGPLQNNGGPTQTMALLSGSPAIDAGNPNGCTDSNGHLLKTDQRGQPRPDKEDTGGCDMGAYESQTD